MKKFFSEFKKFITRGNVVDMAVGVIVGSSFTAIVNGLSNFVLKPVINWILALIIGKDSLSELFTFLIKVETSVDVVDEAGAVIGTKLVPDLAQSIYIDWGSFINAIINFFLVALVLFSIVKLINNFREGQKQFASELKRGIPTKEERKEMKAAGLNYKDDEVLNAFRAEKAKKAEEEKKAAEEKARLEKEANPSTEELLKQIRDLLANK